MKPQDIIFFAVLAILIWKRNSKLSVVVGLIALTVSIPLFATWTFFTAERLVWYAAALFLLAVVFNMLKIKKNER